MNHPHELLADLVDGTLGADDRARVDAHLATCASCREDVAAATAGRDAARAMPTVEAPPDLHERVVTALGRGDAGRPSGPPPWYRWAGVAAAAVLVGIVALSLPEIGGGPGRSADEVAAPDAEATLDAAGEVPPLQVSDRDYGEAELADLASSATTLRGSDEPASVEADAGGDEAAAAARCIRRAFDEQPAGTLVRLIRARFEGTPAYLAVYLEGPGAGEEPDTAVVWAASAETCSVLSFAQARI